MTMNPDELADSAADLLDAAAHHIETYGHGKGRFVDALGRTCALGAITHQGEGMGTYVRRRAVGALRETITHQETTIPWAKGIAEWNDSPDTTADDVITTMQKTAIHLREKVQ